MTSQTLIVLLLLAAGCLSNDVPTKVIDDHPISYDHLGYYIKTVKQEGHGGDAGREGKTLELRTGETPKDYPTDGTAKEPLESVTVARQNDSALPLFITSTARKECMKGYRADENGVCQKTFVQKREKSFDLSRRKRAEQQQPKLSYADVLKYGRTGPLTTPFKAEILTTTPTSVAAGSTAVTTPKPVLTKAEDVTTPPALSAKTAETGTTVPPNSQSSLPAGKIDATPTGKIAEAATTLSPTGQSSVPPGKVEGTPITPTGKIGTTTVPPNAHTGLPAGKVEATSTPLPVKKDESLATTVPAAKPAMKEAVPPASSETPIDKAGSTTSKPAVTTTRPIGRIIPIPTILTGIPKKVKSVLTDLNSAFITGERHSVFAQSSTNNNRAEAFAGAARLRRWIHDLGENQILSNSAEKRFV